MAVRVRRLHFVLAFAYVWYGTWLLAWHYRQYAIMRQYYLQKGTYVSN